MDAEDLRRVMRSMGVDLWTLIETALDVAATDYGKELRARRDGIVEWLYAAGPGAADGCRNCAPGAAAERAAAVGLSTGGMEGKGSSSPAAGKGAATASPLSMNGDEKGEEREGEDDDHPIDDKTKILAIKEFLEDPDQTEDSLVSLLQNLADMEITFKNLKETDIGRHVNGFRKHPSPEVRQLVSGLKSILGHSLPRSPNSHTSFRSLEWLSSESICNIPEIIDQCPHLPIELKATQLAKPFLHHDDFEYSPL